MRASMKHSIKVNDFINVDFSTLNFPMITVYKDPIDFPGKFVGRVFNVGKAKKVEAFPFAVVKDTHEELIKVIPEGFVKIAPDRNDDPKILEIWI